MKLYPIGIQDFKSLISEGFVYIDKTQDAYNILRTGKFYFFSRPRRFGKSLLLSTFKYIFQAEKELFQGLWIYDKHDWKPHPVIHLSFSDIGYKEIGLRAALEQELRLKAAEFGLKLSSLGLGPQFRELITKIQEQHGNVVLLIDEYDKPLIDYIDQIEQAEENREILKGFYAILKGCGHLLRFLFITGVSKFSKVSLFSDLNHLDDLTLSRIAATVCGYTPAELENYFEEEINNLGKKSRLDSQAIREKIKHYYNGYQWELGRPLYNPFSVLSLFRHQKFDIFWWHSGTPSFLIKLLKSEFEYQLEKIEANEFLFESYTLDNLNWQSLMFQTGYFTLESYNPEEEVYTLTYPNYEVRRSMQFHLFEAFSYHSRIESQSLFTEMRKRLEAQDMPGFVEAINVLFANIPHQIFISKQEAFFHAILYLSFKGMGLHVQTEVSTSKGRVDCVVHISSRIYVIEFKLNESAELALSQIREKEYGKPFFNQGKEVLALGISFHSENKEVADWKAETLFMP